MTQYQKDIVYQIVKDFTPIRTEQVKIKAMKLGISCGDRYLRWLAEEDRIEGEKKQGDKTKTWWIKIPNLPTRVIKYDAEKGIPDITIIPQSFTGSVKREQLSLFGNDYLRGNLS